MSRSKKPKPELINLASMMIGVRLLDLSRIEMSLFTYLNDLGVLSVSPEETVCYLES
jgi:hypothetical protein